MLVGFALGLVSQPFFAVHLAVGDDFGALWEMPDPLRAVLGYATLPYALASPSHFRAGGGFASP